MNCLKRCEDYFHRSNSLIQNRCQVLPPICNRLRAICVSLHATGFRWTLLLDWKGQFFPSFYSWCGAFSPSVHTITNKLRPACIWTGWGLWETQEVILNTRCTNHSHQDEGDPKRRVPWCSLPKPRVEVTPRSKSDPKPLSCCVSEKKEPQMIVAYAFIQCVKPGMMYTDDTRMASLNVTCHHGSWVWEPLAGNKWQEAEYTHKPQAYEGHPTIWKS